MAFAYKDISGTSTSEVQQEILSDEILSSDMFLISQQSLSSTSPDRQYLWHGQILNNYYSSRKLEYGKLSSDLFDALSDEFGFRSMAWESSSNYSLIDHVHNYSRVLVEPTILNPEEDEQISTVSFIAAIRIGSETKPIYSPKVTTYKQPKPYLGQLKFMAMTNLPKIDETALDFNGWIYPDGRAISRSIFSEAFEYFGTDFGAGDGSTTFNIPCLSNFMKIAQPGTTNLDEVLVQERQQIEVLSCHSHPLGNLGLSGTIDATTKFKSVGNWDAGEACHGSRGGGSIKKISYDFWFKASNLAIQTGQNSIESTSISKTTHPTYNKLPVLMYIGVRENG